MDKNERRMLKREKVILIIRSSSSMCFRKSIISILIRGRIITKKEIKEEKEFQFFKDEEKHLVVKTRRNREKKMHIKMGRKVLFMFSLEQQEDGKEMTGGRPSNRL